MKKSYISVLFLKEVAFPSKYLEVPNCNKRFLFGKRFEIFVG